MNLFRDNREIVDKLSASFKKNGKSIPLEAFKEKLQDLSYNGSFITDAAYT